MYVKFIDLEKACDKVNRETLRMYDVGGKILSGIKNIYVDSLARIKVKGGESERFTIDSGKRLCLIIINK